MNKHIELVKKWLANPKSVTQQELEDNRNAAWATWSTNAFYAAVYYAAFYAAHAAYYTANTVYADTDSSAAYYVKYWIKSYEELKGQEDER